MKVKLIQAGGFMGRSKTAEEELSNYPAAVTIRLNTMLSELQTQANDLLQESADLNNADSVRDGFKYFIEYEGQRTEINENVPFQGELKGLLATLKERLKY